MHVFFEDDGAFKAGTVLADNDSSLQVEAISGKRLKLKAANVLLRFSGPAPSILLADAQAIAAGIDPDFLWEVSGDTEFGFAELAKEYPVYDAHSLSRSLCSIRRRPLRRAASGPQILVRRRITTGTY